MAQWFIKEVGNEICLQTQSSASKLLKPWSLTFYNSLIRVDMNIMAVLLICCVVGVLLSNSASVVFANPVMDFKELKQAMQQDTVDFGDLCCFYGF